MKTNKISRVLNKLCPKAKDIYSGYSLSTYEDFIEVHYFHRSEVYEQLRLSQMSEALANAGFQVEQKHNRLVVTAN